MKKCLFCKNKVEETQSICPHCGSVKFDKISKYTYRYENKETDAAFLQAYHTSEESKKPLILGAICLSVLIVCVTIMNWPCTHDYEERIVSKADYTIDGTSEYECTKCGHSYTKTFPKLECPVEIQVLNKSNHEKESEQKTIDMGNGHSYEIVTFYNKWVLFDIEIKNISDKDISKVKGTLVITSGEESYDFECEIEEKIPAKSTVVISEYSFSIGNLTGTGYNYNALAVYRSAPSSLSYNFILSEVEYTD